MTSKVKAKHNDLANKSKSTDPNYVFLVVEGGAVRLKSNSR